jgi:isopentenyl phosphate kinase
MERMIIVKIGGSAITDKEKEKEFKAREMAKIAKALKGQKILIIHGGGSFGHALAKKYRIAEGEQKDVKDQALGFCRTQEAMQEMNALVIAGLLKEEIPAFPVQASGFVVMAGGRAAKADFSAVKELIDIGVVPVLYGVPAADTKQKYSILSGDELVYLLAKELRPERVILVSDVNGIYDSNPKTNKKARLIEEITKESICIKFEKNTKDVTGGMERKLNELLRLADESIESVVVDADGLGAALRGEKRGTRIK